MLFATAIGVRRDREDVDFAGDEPVVAERDDAAVIVRDHRDAADIARELESVDTATGSRLTDNSFLARATSRLRLFFGSLSAFVSATMTGFSRSCSHGTKSSSSSSALRRISMRSNTPASVGRSERYVSIRGASSRACSDRPARTEAWKIDEEERRIRRDLEPVEKRVRPGVTLALPSFAPSGTTR